MTDDEPTDAPLESHDEDDLQLKQMRSVWLSMRDDDQDPSDRGMAALMTAAREQAEAMKPKRSWWAVLLEQLRRPPVLAMATAVVLIGGAVVISQRDAAMKTESELADSDSVADKTIASPNPVATPPSRDDGAKLEEAPGAEDERDRGGAAMGSAGLVPPAEPVVTQQRPRPHKPKPPQANGPSAGESGLVDHLSMAPPADPKPEAKKEDAKAPLQLATGDEDLQPKGATVTESTSAGQAPEHKSVTRKPLPAIEGEDRAAKDASVAQLIKQCEAAAAKNDCAAVRTIAAKIARQDPQTYRNRVMKNAKVAQCLEPPAPMEAAPISAD